MYLLICLFFLVILFVHSFASGPVIGLHAHPQIVVYTRLVFCDLMALRLPCAWELIVLLPGLFGYWTSGWLAGWRAWLAGWLGWLLLCLDAWVSVLLFG